MEGFAHTRRLAVEWGHCDPAGIVFNPRFFEYFDYSTALLLEVALGHSKGSMMAAYGLAGIPLVETRATFKAPCRFGDAVDIRSTVVELKRSSFRVRHVLTRDDLVCVEGEEVRVWSGRDAADPTRLRSRPIPDDVLAKLGP